MNNIIVILTLTVLFFTSCSDKESLSVKRDHHETIYKPTGVKFADWVSKTYYESDQKNSSQDHNLIDISVQTAQGDTLILSLLVDTQYVTASLKTSNNEEIGNFVYTKNDSTAQYWIYVEEGKEQVFMEFQKECYNMIEKYNEDRCSISKLTSKR